MAVGQNEPGRLLLVDDEVNVLRSLTRALDREGWTVKTATDGATALDLARAFEPQVIISDFQMPGMSGVEFLARAKALIPTSQRIILTGQADQRAVTDAINRSEVFRFVSKPWDSEELIQIIRSAFEQHRLRTDNERLLTLSQAQNEELRSLASSLEARVMDRTRALSTAKREWETAFDALQQPLAVVDESYVVRRGNVAFAETAHQPIQALGSRPTCYAFLFGRAEPCTGCPLPLALRTLAPAHASVAHQGRQFNVFAYPVPEERQCVCTYRDVTDEQALTRLQIDTEKMAAVGQLAGGVAHEINNPLGGILAFAQLMMREPDRSASDLEGLGIIQDSALRCKRIVDSLLKFSRRPSKEPEPVDLARCMEDTALLFGAQLKASPRAHLRLQLAPGLPYVMGNANQLEQVALNLLQNGLHALPAGEGELTLETGLSPEGCYFAVSDTGCGIPPQDLPRIFEPWFTTKRAGDGTGLGLSIASRIVTDHGGRIHTQTEVGKGSRFTVVLPVMDSLKH